MAPGWARDGLAGTSRVTSAPDLSGKCLLFDDLVVGSHLTVYNGVVFLTSDGPLTVVDDDPGFPFSAPNSILPDNSNTPGNHTMARPAVAVKGAGVTMGDYDGDQDTIYLNAYDKNGNLVKSVSGAVPASLYGGVSLSVKSTTANIAYIDFYGVGTNNNSVYFDNVCFAR